MPLQRTPKQSWPITGTNMSTMTIHPSMARDSMPNLHSDLVSTRSRTFGTASPTSSWHSIRNMPADVAKYAIDPATWEDSKATDIKRHSFDEKLDPFQRALLCLDGDVPQKIFAAHDVINLVKLNSNKTFDVVIPVIESQLKTSSNSEFHLEFSQSLVQLFRDMMRARSARRIKHILEFLNYMAENTSIDIMRSWLEALEAIIDQMSPKDAMTQILPLIEEKTKKGTKPEIKNSACVLMRKLVLHSTDTKTIPYLLKPVGDLVGDESVVVRSAVCLLLPVLISKSDPETIQEFEKEISRLAMDSSTFVKAFLVDTICRIIIPSKIEAATMDSFLCILKKMVKEAYAIEPPNVQLLIHFSKYVASIAKVLKEKQSLTMEEENKLWFLDAFIQLSRYDLPAKKVDKGDKELPPGFSNFRNMMHTNRRASVLDSLLSTPLKTEKAQRPKDSPAAKSINGSNNNAVPSSNSEEIEKWMCRAYIAANFPDFIPFGKPLVDFKNGLHPLVTDLVHDPNESVRKNMAANMFALMEQVGDQAGILKEEIVRVLSDDHVDVIDAILPNLANIMKILVKTQVVSPDNTTSALAEIGGVILFCEERLSQTRDWRVHSSLLLHMVVLPFCIPCDYIYKNFVPILLHRLLHLNQLPSRLGAAEALVSFLRNCRRANQRDDIRRKIKGFAQSRSAQDRMLYLYMSNMIMDRFSRTYFRDHFFETTLELADDTIPNVRIKAANLMPKMKEKTRMADDVHLIKKLEEVVQRIKNSETDRDAMEAINNALLEVAKIDTYLKSEAANRVKDDKDKEDFKKEREEVFIASLEAQMPKFIPKRNSQLKSFEVTKPAHQYASARSTGGSISKQGYKRAQQDQKNTESKKPFQTAEEPSSAFSLTRNSKNTTPNTANSIQSSKLTDENSSQTTLSTKKPH